MRLHYLLWEAILCHGGSQQLVNIFNRIGAAAALDTSQRISTQVVLLTINFWHSSTSCVCILYWCNTHLERYICTVRAASPLVSSFHTRGNYGFEYQSCREIFSNILIASAIPVEKAKRRRWTLAQVSSPHTTLVLPATNLEPQYLVSWAWGHDGWSLPHTDSEAILYCNG